MRRHYLRQLTRWTLVLHKCDCKADKIVWKCGQCGREVTSGIIPSVGHALAPSSCPRCHRNTVYDQRPDDEELRGILGEEFYNFLFR